MLLDVGLPDISGLVGGRAATPRARSAGGRAHLDARRGRLRRPGRALRRARVRAQGGAVRRAIVGAARAERWRAAWTRDDAAGDGHPSTDGARRGAEPGRDGRPARRAGARAAGDRREPRLAAGRGVGARAGPARGAALRRDLARGRRRRGGVRGAPAASTSLAPGEGLPGRVWQSGEPAWIADVLADEQLPARAGGARAPACMPAFCFPIRSARGVLGVIEFFTGEPREPDSELLGDDGRARRSDRPGGRAPPRRRGAAREGGAPPRDARRRARLRRDDGPRGPRRGLQPRRRADLRLRAPTTPSAATWPS